MKKLALTSFLTAMFLVSIALPSEARGGHGGGGGGHHGGFHGGFHHHHFRGTVVVGVGSGFGWDPWWYYPPYYAYPPYAYAPVVEEPPVYIEQSSPPAAPTPEANWWYYCQSSRSYYPTVPTCSEAWIKVAPRDH